MQYSPAIKTTLRVDKKGS